MPQKGRVLRLENHLRRPAVQAQLGAPRWLLVFLAGGLRAVLGDRSLGTPPFTQNTFRGMIQLLGACEDECGLARTMPSRTERRAEWQMDRRDEE